MGWNITLRSDKPIWDEVVEDCIKEMPPKWRGWLGSDFGPDTFNNGMWHCAVDVYAPKGMELTLHGAYGLSGDIAEPFAKMMALLLEKRGHKILIGEMS